MPWQERLRKTRLALTFGTLSCGKKVHGKKKCMSKTCRSNRASCARAGEHFLQGFFFFFAYLFPVAQNPCRRRLPGPTEALLPQYQQGPWRLPNAGSCQRTSARTSCRSGASPAM